MVNFATCINQKKIWSKNNQMIYDLWISINYIHWSWRKNSEHMKHNEKSLHCRLSFQKAYMPLNNSAYTRILCTVPKFWNVFFQSPMINTKMNIKRFANKVWNFDPAFSNKRVDMFVTFLLIEFCRHIQLQQEGLCQIFRNFLYPSFM